MRRELEAQKAVIARRSAELDALQQELESEKVRASCGGLCAPSPLIVDGRVRNLLKRLVPCPCAQHKTITLVAFMVVHLQVFPLMIVSTP